VAHMPSPRNKLVPEERVDVLRVRPQGVLFSVTPCAVMFRSSLVPLSSLIDAPSH